jgi:hydroxyethylthiazole kinase-like uncharacterized protein yjeF
VDPRLAPDTFWPRLHAALAAVDVEERTPPPEARVGAVLVLLEQTDAGPCVVLTRRRRDLRSHPGQVSFAGGRLDAGETIEEAALREAEEEIGLDRTTVEVLGAGSRFYIPPSRFWVVPVFARWAAPHELRPNPWEVDEILRVPLTHLLDEGRWRHVPLSLRGSSWAWQLDDDLLWGATAIVMALLLEVAVDGWSGGRRPEDLPDDLAVRPWEDAPPWQRRMRLEGELPERSQDEVPHVTVETMRAVDRLLDEAGLGLASLAEQAGRALAHAARRLVGGAVDGTVVTVLAGHGGNGAGGLAGARLLASAGADVRVLLVRDTVRLPGQRDVLERWGVDVRVVDPGAPPGARDLPGDLVIDAMLGYGADPPLRGVPEQLAEWLRRHDVPVVALDLPSGLGADVGLRGPCVTADVTVTLAAPKVGLLPPITHPYVGDLYLADLGVPPEVWRAVGVEPVVFDRGPLVRLTVPAANTDAGTPDQGEVPRV